MQIPGSWCERCQEWWPFPALVRDSGPGMAWVSDDTEEIVATTYRRRTCPECDGPLELRARTVVTADIAPSAEQELSAELDAFARGELEI